MGSATLAALLEKQRRGAGISISVLARDSKRNRAKMSLPMQNGVNVVWGDLEDRELISRCASEADIVLHVGGMVSPEADWHPEKTLRVNVAAMENIVEGAKRAQTQGRDVEVVYIGSVSQLGGRDVPRHWSRSGDPVNISAFDSYALSKCLAELTLAESGLKRWVSLRQTGILHSGLLLKASDPIAMHVPLKGVLEWVTAEQSGLLLANLATKENIPEDFWRGFYNIGGGKGFRVTNYEFIQLNLKAVGCPPAEKSFERRWFATRNFHGVWYEDSDLLEDLFHFRGEGDIEDYLNDLKSRLPFWFKLAPLAPAFLIRAVMGKVAATPLLGPMSWVKNRDQERLYAAFGGYDAWKGIPGWKKGEFTHPDSDPIRLEHGYDETKPLQELTIEEMRKAAGFRGGKCLNDKMESPDSPLEWECSEGHRFRLTPRSVLKGGHWCPQCLKAMKESRHNLERQASKSEFLRQVLPEE